MTKFRNAVSPIARPRRTFRWLALCALMALVCLFSSHSASAHPADMYFHAHTLHLSPEQLRVEWVITPGPLLVQSIWYQVDQDLDGEVAAEDAEAWFAPYVKSLVVVLDGAEQLDLQLESLTWPSSLEAFLLGDESIVVQLAADWPASLSGQHQLLFHDQHEEKISTNWFYLYGLEGLRFEAPEQQNALLRVALHFPKPSENATGLLEFWESGAPVAQSEASSTDDELSALFTESPSTILTNLLRAPELSGLFFLSAFFIAMALGGLHALTPGHGKAIVAAYLIGSKGTTRHAVALGGVVTLAHTGSVFAFGLLTLVVSRYILPTSLFPLLEIASGLLIAGLGAGLLYQRWKSWRAESALQRSLAELEMIKEYDRAGGRARIIIDQPIREPGPEHEHKRPLPAPGAEVSWRSIFTLGLSGGLVPCPDAIAILLIAITINRIALGLSLIVAFSLGLAFILIAVGMTIVHSRRLLQRLRGFDRLATITPLVSAVVVLVLGLALTVGALQSGGLWTPERLGELSAYQPESATREATFALEPASFIYLADDEDYLSQLAVFPISGDTPVFLTDEESGVWEYALSPDRSAVVYPVLRADAGSDLYLANADGSAARLLLACPGADCSGVAWAPDGERLIYQHRELAVGAEVTFSTLWWLDLPTGETEPVFSDQSFPGYSPSFSPDGRWLSYISVGNASIQVYNLQDGRHFSLPTKAGSSALWSPDSSALLFADIVVDGDRYLSHISYFDLESEQIIDLGNGQAIEDYSAAWSPDGEWLAVVRRQLDQTTVGYEDQIWLIRPDGGEAQQLTDESRVHHGPPVWSPDGHYLLFHRYQLGQPNAPPSIWLLDVESGELTKLVEPGITPLWLP